MSTYRERTEQEKYSHVATLDEVKANDYNLNIPRYVDTFEAEEAVDPPQRRGQGAASAGAGHESDRC